MVMHRHVQHNLIIENIEKHMITNLTRVIEVKQKLHDIIANKCCNNMVVMIVKLPAEFEPNEECRPEFSLSEKPPSSSSDFFPLSLPEKVLN
jgi:hypothetical protein